MSPAEAFFRGWICDLDFLLVFPGLGHLSTLHQPALRLGEGVLSFLDRKSVV